MTEVQTGTARRLVLGAFCVAANLYLIGFALDSLLSIIDDTGRWLSGHPIIPIRNLVAELVVLASPVLILILIFVPHLPKRALLPPALFALWAAFGSPGAPDVLHGPGSPARDILFWGGLQAALAAIAFALVRRRTGEWLLRPARLPKKSHLVLRTFAALVATIVALPVLIALMWGGHLVNFFEEGSGHFIDFRWTGIDTQERVLTKDGKEVHLVGMMHFAEPMFYANLALSFDPHALVLTEGVSDRDGLMKKSLSYENAASLLGLSVQPSFGAGVPSEDAADAPKDGPAPPADDTGGPQFVNADVDFSEFSQPTRAFLEHVGALYGSRTTEELIQNLDAVVKQAQTTDMQAVMADIVIRRNAKVIAAFDALEGDYQTIHVPWGALHMPGLQEAFESRGYKLAQTRQLHLVRFGFANRH